MRLSVLSVFSLALAVPALAAEPDFAYDLDGKVAWYELTDAGTFMLATNKSVLGISPETGEIAWERDDLKKVLESGVTSIPDTPAAFVLQAELGTLHLLDVTTGQDFWTMKGGPVMFTQVNLSDGAVFVLTQEWEKKGSYYVMSYVDIATGDVRWSKDHYFGVKPAPLALQKANPDKMWSLKLTAQGNQPLQILDGGTSYLELWQAKQGVTKRSMDTGEIIWNRPGKYKTGVPTPMGGRPLMQLTDSTVFVTNNESRLWAYRLDTGEPVWTEKKAPKQFGTIYTVIPSGKNVLISGSDDKKSFAMMVDATTGEEAWKRPLKLKGMITHLEELDDGRLVVAETIETTTLVRVAKVSDGKRALKKPIKLPGTLSWSSIEDNRFFGTGSNGSKTYVGMWDLSTGISAWEGGKGYRLKGTVPNLVMHEDKVLFVDSRGYFTALNRDDGTEIFRNELDFKGQKETPKVLAWRDDLLVTFSDQNVFGLKPDGSILYHTRYAPPPPTGLQIAAGAALIVAAAASSVASASHAAAAGYAQGMGAHKSSRVVTKNNLAADSYAGIASSFGAAADSVMRRAKASKASEDNFYILTKIKGEDEKGVGLVRIDLKTGKETGSIIIDTRKPQYEIDEITGVLYLIRKEKRLEVYRFDK